MKKLIQIKCIAITFLLSNVLHAQVNESQITDYITSVFHGQGPGITLLIAKDGKPIYRKSFGKANLELNVPMTPDNVFELGSITKQFTAVAILMLEEQGKLKIEDPIMKYFPKYPSQGKRITIHHLLNHTSGIKNYSEIAKLRKYMSMKMTPNEIIDAFKNEPLDFDTGEEFRYSNSGYVMLGHIIELVSGETYEEFIKKNIFNKLGMVNSYNGSKKKVIKNRASGYQGQNNNYENPAFLDMSITFAAGSIMATVDDLIKWQNAINSNVLITRKSLEKAINGSILNTGEKIIYGYGWISGNINGSKTIEHNGALFGYASNAIFLPEEHIYVVGLSNCDDKNTADVVTKVASMVIGKPFPNYKDAISLTEKQLKKWTGAYQFEDGVVRYITLENGKLMSQRGGGSKFHIYPMSDNYFIFKEDLSVYRFSINEGGDKQVAMKTNNYDYKYIGKEIDKISPSDKVEITLSPRQLEQYVGKYELQPGLVITITTENSKLLAQVPGQPLYELFSESEDHFFLKTILASVVFNKNASGSIESLTLDQGGQKMSAKKI